MGPHAGSVVLHLDGDVAPRAPGAHADALVLPSVLHGIVQQVEHHLRHGVAIHVHGRKLRIQLRLVAGGQLLRLERLTDAIEQGRNLGPLQLEGGAARFQPRPVEQPLHHAREPIGLGGEHRHALAHLLRTFGPSCAQGLGEETDPGQRRPQLVRDVRHEVRLQPRQLVGAPHLADGQPESHADPEVEQHEQRDVQGPVAEGERRRGIARQLRGQRESLQRRPEPEARNHGRGLSRLRHDAAKRRQRCDRLSRREEAERGALAGEARLGQPRHQLRDRGDVELGDQRALAFRFQRAHQRERAALASHLGGGEDVTADRQRGRAADGIGQLRGSRAQRLHREDQRVRLGGGDGLRRLVEAGEQIEPERAQARVVLLRQPALHRGALVRHRDHAEGHQRHARKQHAAQQPDEGAAEFDQLGRLRHLLSF